MLKTIIELNIDSLTKNKNIIEDKLSSKGLELKSLTSTLNANGDSLVSGTNWINELKERVVKELVFISSHVNELLNVSFLEDYEEVEFKHDDSKKKIFLTYLSKEWESPISMASAISTFHNVDKIEAIRGKSVLELDIEEISQSIIDLFSDMEYHKLRYQINIISRYQNFYANQAKVKVDWSKFKDVKVLKEIIGDSAKEHVLTKRDLVSLTKVMPNIQDSIIPLLIFEGVSFSKVDDIDEIRYLKSSDLNGNELTIEGNNSPKRPKRTITLSPDVSELVREAINQDYIVKSVGGEIELIGLEDTDFILRPAEKSRGKNKSSEHSDVISYRGAYSRVNNCRRHVEQFLYDIKFTPKAVETFGKIYHINKLINEGFEEVESITATLIRFGDWYPEEDSRRNPKNSQQINRLRKQWLLYT